MFDHGEDIVGKYDVGMLEFSFSRLALTCTVRRMEEREASV